MGSGDAEHPGPPEVLFRRRADGSDFLSELQRPAKPYPPPPQNNATAMSGMDQRHLFMILGTGTTQPMSVQSVSVWQTSSANNLPE